MWPDSFYDMTYIYMRYFAISIEIIQGNKSFELQYQSRIELA